MLQSPEGIAFLEKMWVALKRAGLICEGLLRISAAVIVLFPKPNIISSRIRKLVTDSRHNTGKYGSTDMATKSLVCTPCKLTMAANRKVLYTKKQRYWLCSLEWHQQITNINTRAFNRYWLITISDYFLDPEGVPNRHDGCSCCYRFWKMPKALLIRNGKLRNSTHIRDIISDRSTVLDFSPDGATFRVHSTFRTCLYPINR